jgi:hypothetical protein
MIVCNRCGKENQDHYKFCLGCGAELTAPAKPGGDIAVMKTMMADSSQLSPRPTGGTPAPFPGQPGAQMRPPGGPMPGQPQPLPGMPGGHLGGPTQGGPMQGGPMPGGPMPGPGPMPPGPGGPLGGPMGGPMPGFGGAPPQQPHQGGMGAPMGAPMGPPPGVPAPGFGGPSPGFPPTPSAQMASMPGGNRRCPQCSTEVPPNFRFCGSCGFRMDEVSAPNPMPQAPQPMAPPPVQAPPQPRAMMTLIRPDGSEGGSHELKAGENKIGRTFAPIFENDGYLSPTHAEIIVGVTQAVVRDLGSLNGVFVKMTEEEEILPGQVFRIGQELLRFDLVNPPDPMPDGTEVMGSPNPGYWGKITVIIGKEVDGSAFPLLGESITLGRERGEINFPDDGYVSGLHARVITRDGRVFLTDLGSSNGTFFKIAGERTVGNESFVLFGQQLFRINL